MEEVKSNLSKEIQQKKKDRTAKKKDRKSGDLASQLQPTDNKTEQELKEIKLQNKQLKEGFQKDVKDDVRRNEVMSSTFDRNPTNRKLKPGINHGGDE